MEVQDVLMKKNLGAWRPNLALSNLAIKYFEEPTYAHKRIFPVCQVQLPGGHYYEFSKEDLARDNVKLKPPYGSVQPAVFGIQTKSYDCKVWQALTGLDRLMTLPYEREGAINPRDYRVKFLAEQIALHQEIEFAEKFFNASAWANVWTGAATGNAAQKKFKKFDASDSDPITFLDTMAIELKRAGRRKPNKLALGVETYKAIRNNPYVKELVKYSGTTQKPAVVNEQVLAQVFGVDAVIVMDATYNAAPQGMTEDMKYVCDAKGALLLYSPENPSTEEPSAGYIFTWLINGGDYIAVEEHEGAPASHTDILEAIIAYDMEKTSDALAVYFDNCVG